MFCSVVAQRGTHKVLKLSVGLRTQSVECSKLGKTRIIADANPGWLENAAFFEQNVSYAFQLKSTDKLSIILLIASKFTAL